EKVRLEFSSDLKSVGFGGNRLFFKGQDSLEADQIRKPMSARERRAAKRQRAEAEGYGPLFKTTQ
ncbi:MAG TPA: hypothetical protein VIY48_21735, partial [Candidatus Paceibacterota bacterium]